jgi:ABC-type branched-subunit amino acid transport system ATPase component
MNGQALLEVQGLNVWFGALKAVTDMELVIRPGEIVGLIGPNGAGKSTVVNGISGLVPVRKGRILLEGRDISGIPSFRRFRAGLGRTFQHVALADGLTGRQCLRVVEARGRYRTPGRGGVSDDTLALCREVGLESVLDRRVESMSFLHRRLLSIVSAIAGSTRVALLDEATAGLSRAERASVGGALRALIAAHPDRGLLVIEHDLEFVRSVTTRSVAMVGGRFITEGPTDEVLRDPTLVTAYIGEG